MTTLLFIEEWRPVVGYEGRYSVSSLGRVKSLERQVRVGHGATRTVRERILRPGPKASGHLSVALGKGASNDVHVLVAAAFLGPRPAGHDVRHLDDDPTNNRRENLAYGTRRDNIQDAVRNGSKRWKLTLDDVRTIRARLAAGESVRSVATDFPVSEGHISNIKAGRTHQHVRGTP